MKKTLLVTLGLLLVAAALGVYVIKTKPKETQKKGDWEPELLVDPQADLTRLTLIRPEDKIVIEKIKGTDQWKLAEPVQSFVEPYFVLPIIGDLTNLKREKIISIKPETLTIYQLDDPMLEVIYEFGDGSDPIKLSVGKLNYTRDFYYAKLDNSDTVFLVAPTVHLAAQAPMDAFRSKILLYHEASDVGSFQIKIEDPDYKTRFGNALEPKLVIQGRADEKPQWVIVSPIHENANFKMVDNFFLGFKNTSALTVIDVPDDKLSEYGLDPPKVRIGLIMRNGEKEEIQLGGMDETGTIMYARNAGGNEVLPLPIEAATRIIVAHFRMPHKFTLALGLQMVRMEVSSPEIENGGFVIVSDGKGGYHLDNQPDKIVLPQGINYFLKPFANEESYYIRHNEPFDLPSYGIEPARMRIKVTGPKNELLDVSIGVAAKQGDDLATFYFDHLQKSVFMIKKDILSGMPLTEKDLVATPEEVQKRNDFLQKKHRRRKNMLERNK